MRDTMFNLLEPISAEIDCLDDRADHSEPEQRRMWREVVALLRRLREYVRQQFAILRTEDRRLRERIDDLETELMRALEEVQCYRRVAAELEIHWQLTGPCPEDMKMDEALKYVDKLAAEAAGGDE